MDEFLKIHYYISLSGTHIYVICLRNRFPATLLVVTLISSKDFEKSNSP